jgi:hypothetical protein
MYPMPREQSVRPDVALEMPGTDRNQFSRVDPSPPVAVERVTYSNMLSQWFRVLGMTICRPLAVHPFASVVLNADVQPLQA